MGGGSSGEGSIKGDVRAANCLRELLMASFSFHFTALLFWWGWNTVILGVILPGPLILMRAKTVNYDSGARQRTDLSTLLELELFFLADYRSVGVNFDMNFVAFFNTQSPLEPLKGISCRLSSIQSDCKNTIWSSTFALPGLFANRVPDGKKVTLDVVKVTGWRRFLPGTGQEMDTIPVSLTHTAVEREAKSAGF